MGGHVFLEPGSYVSAPGLQVTEGKSDWSANHLELLMQFPSYPPQVEGKLCRLFRRPVREGPKVGGELKLNKVAPPKKVARNGSLKGPLICRVSQITTGEIRRSPVDMVNIPLFIHYLQDFSTISKWLEMGFLNHQLRRMSKD